MIKKLLIAAFAYILLSTTPSFAEEMNIKEFRGVVTYHLIPARVMRINTIIEDPEPGSSIIGNESILIEVDDNPDVMANWTVVKIKYYKYPQPKTFKYEALSKEYEITVNYYAEEVVIDGDLSAYTQK